MLSNMLIWQNLSVHLKLTLFDDPDPGRSQQEERSNVIQQALSENPAVE